MIARIDMDIEMLIVRVIEIVLIFFVLRFLLLRDFKKSVEAEVKSIKLSASEARLGVEIMTEQSRKDERRLDTLSKAVEIVRKRLLDVEAKLRSTRVVGSKDKGSREAISSRNTDKTEPKRRGG